MSEPRFPALARILQARGHATFAEDAMGSPASQLRRARERVAQGNLSSAELAKAAAQLLELRYLSEGDFQPDPNALKVLSFRQLEQMMVIPYQDDGRVLLVVAANPFDLSLKERLRHLCGREVEIAVGDPREIASFLKRAASSHLLKATAGASETEGKKVESIQEGNEHNPVVKFVNSLLASAVEKRASDIHLETSDDRTMVRFRIDGVLYPATEDLDKAHHSALVSRLKVMAELDIAEKRLPQDGRFNHIVGEREIDFRVSILPSIHGEDVVIRVLDKSAIAKGIAALSLDRLGLSEPVVRRLRKTIREPYGMVLITGPTGSGKTTTLYAALSECDLEDEKVVTIEDPVEYHVSGVVQIAVNEKKNLSFARGLRSILRHDPDKVMVGEIRDSETAQIAIQSALTGHLVFSTVHANNAVDVMNRFSHMGLNLYNVVSALNCVIAQRLVRMICPHCRDASSVTRDELELSGLDPDRHRETTWFEGRGCAQCGGTGYRGRTAVAEFLQMSSSIREMIVRQASHEELEAAAAREGMVTLRQAAVEKAIAGITTLREVNRVTFS